MTDKPAGLRPQYAKAFLQESVARAYRHRPPYPQAVVDALLSLLGEAGGAVLDVGCGTGELSRRLAGSVERVDAVDVSQPMIDEGRRENGGDHARLRWICARLEEAELSPPYGLVLAADSLHWLDWPVALPKLHDALRPDGWVAIVHRTWGTRTEEETELLVRYSTNQEFRPFNLVEELQSRGLFRGRNHVPVRDRWRPTIEEYVEARHAQASLSREDLGEERSAAFDGELTALLHRLVADGRLTTRDDHLDLQVVADVGWGRPLPG